LVPFFEPLTLAHTVADLLDNPEERALLGAQARARAVERYDLKTVCLPQQLEWVQSLLAKSP
jgi:glycosyltransferase involved in cell wall biosynthesis